MRGWAFAVLGLSATVATADEVLLASGGKLAGVANEVGENLVVETAYGTVTVPKAQVVAIDRRVKTVVEEFKAREASTDITNADQVWALSRWAKENGLHGRARHLARRTVELHPDHEAARKELGYHRFQGRWLTYEQVMIAKGFVKHEGKWLTPSELELKLAAEAKERERKAELRRKREEARKAREAARRKSAVPYGEANPKPIYVGATPSRATFYTGYNLYGPLGAVPSIQGVFDLSRYIDITPRFRWP